MSAVPTVRIKSDIPGCEAGLDINESDFDPAKHVLFDAEPIEKPKVGKGPGGKWYIKIGKKTQAGPFQTEAEAQAALDAANAEIPDGAPTPIPEDWEAMTDDEMVALAAELIGEDVTSEETTVVEKARSIILATVTDRAGK